jgi:hypothetical protein
MNVDAEVAQVVISAIDEMSTMNEMNEITKTDVGIDVITRTLVITKILATTKTAITK